MKKILAIMLACPLMVYAAGVINSFAAPSSDISGLAWDGSAVWAIDRETQNIYELNPSDGSILSSFHVEDQPTSYDIKPSGIACVAGNIFIIMSDGDYYCKGYMYSTDGEYDSSFDMLC